MADVTRADRIAHIKEHPDMHKHTFDGLQRCCMVGGAIDLSIMEAHETYAKTGTNGGRNCDVTRGPCSCGAWH
jgi:hypothetical protein